MKISWLAHAKILCKLLPIAKTPSSSNGSVPQVSHLKPGAYNAETFSQRQIDLSSPQVQASAQLSIKIQSSKAGLISSSQDRRVFNGRVMTASLKKNLLLSNLTSETISTAKKHARQPKLIANSLMKFLYGYSLDVKRFIKETILKGWK